MACYPIVHKDIWEYYKKAQSCFWVAEEINLFEDLNDWKKLKPEEQYFISMVLAFFAEADAIVNVNINENLIKVPYKEAQYFYGFQVAMENIHNETYSLLIDTYIKNEDEKMRLLESTKNFQHISEKNAWAADWILFDDIRTSLIAFVIVEGLFFSGSFCALFWLKDRGILKGLTFSNELISRDEGLHVEFGAFLYKKMVKEKHIKQLAFKTVAKMMIEAVKIETGFICESLKCDMIGMNKDLMTQYIKFVADYLMSILDYPKLYDVKNPFPFMENISMLGKTNFFERKNSEYMITTEKPEKFQFNSDDF
jgi:ribonucleoside-diphosphate reductase beta chain